MLRQDYSIESTDGSLVETSPEISRIINYILLLTLLSVRSNCHVQVKVWIELRCRGSRRVHSRAMSGHRLGHSVHLLGQVLEALGATNTLADRLDPLKLSVRNGALDVVGVPDLVDFTVATSRQGSDAARLLQSSNEFIVGVVLRSGGNNACSFQVLLVVRYAKYYEWRWTVPGRSVAS